MKTVLIPTDFSIESLNTVKGALKQCEGENTNLILVYGVYLSDSITDLLFFSKPKYLSTLQSEKFTQACEILKNKYDLIFVYAPSPATVGLPAIIIKKSMMFFLEISFIFY